MWMCECVGVCMGSQYLRCVDEGYAFVTESGSQQASAQRAFQKGSTQSACTYTRLGTFR